MGEICSSYNLYSLGEMNNVLGHFVFDAHLSKLLLYQICQQAIHVQSLDHFYHTCYLTDVFHWDCLNREALKLPGEMDSSGFLCTVCKVNL